ncbi:hypothetical protein BH23ACT5_BH23ACT5_24600 [soil metagenome]
MRERLRGLGGMAPLQVVGSVVGIGAIALGLPVLELLGRNPEFFIARRFPSTDLVVLACALVVLPAVAVLPVLLARTWGPVPSAVLHLLAVASLAAVAVASMLVAAGAGSLPPALFVAGCGVLGVMAAWAFARYSTVQSAVGFLGLAPIALVAWFLWLTPISQLVFTASSEVVGSGAAGTPYPVVILVFDEFPAASITLGDGSLDTDNHPHLARLAADGVWYRNAVSVRQQTEESLPTILTGMGVPEGSIPTAVDHPFNLFTLLSDQYDVAAVENVTELCPDHVCSNESRPVAPVRERWPSLISDLAVVYAHLVFPGDLSSRLPPLDQAWEGFGQQAVVDFDMIERFLDYVDDDRRLEMDRFLRTFDTIGDEPPIRFGHFLYPHHPWDIEPDGRINLAARPPGRFEVGWGSDPFLVAQGWQRHLLAVQWTDTMVGRVLDRLEEEGIYDETLVIVVADHGIAIRPDTRHQRVITPDSIGSVAAVPLFVKYPTSRAGAPTPGTVDVVRAETTDIVATVADVLDMAVPWTLDGTSLLEVDERRERTESVMIGTEGPVHIPPDDADLLAEALEKERWFPGGDPYALAPPGWSDLLGQIVEPGGSDLPIDQAGLIEAHVPGGDPVPSFLSGSFGGNGGGDIVAVMVDGVVVAVTTTFPVDGGGKRWEALIPAELLDDGPEVVEAWLVEGSPREAQFRG